MMAKAVEPDELGVPEFKSINKYVDKFVDKFIDMFYNNIR
jgi:hypothetical protein